MRRPTRLPRWQEWTAYTCAAALIATGLAWLAFDWWVRVEGEFGLEHHPAQSWLLIAHGIGAYAFLIVAGAMIPVHIVMGWRTRRNLWSGLTLVGLCTLLALTALGLYYIAADNARSWTSLIHWIMGLAVVPVLLVHAIRGRRGA
jgi:hypothetical protein